MKIVIIQPPFVQLNSPYPSGAYLSNFFKQNFGFSGSVKWLDLSIQLFDSIFSKEGLSKLFELSEQNALQIANKAEQNGDDFTAFNLRRYVSTKNAWINYIDQIKSILNCKNSGREVSHKFIFSASAPRGNRMESFLANLKEEPTVDQARFLASLALADLADYITFAFDKNFSLIRYAEAVSTENKSFKKINEELKSPILNDFYIPLLQKIFLENGLTKNQTEQTLFCITLPFAGTFVSGLSTAKFIKENCSNALVCIGGGFANTELRNLQDSNFGSFFDFISFDRGYGSYFELFNALKKLGENFCSDDFLQFAPFYKLRIFNKISLNNGTFFTENINKIIDCQCLDLEETEESILQKHKEAIDFENKITFQNVPDYSDIDFALYPRVCDDKNPMHRLWNDGTWIKAYLAHGCYWHKCAFCDVHLDYVCGYKTTNVQNVYNGLLKTAKSKGVYGVHLVDEAMPSVLAKQFALENIKNDCPLFYWGNVRFEKSFTPDLADFLAFSGLGGVSAGIEIATGKGLDIIHKGTDIDSIVAACAAFKEAGILVHSYMIYGFWFETPQDLVNSMETLRQFFACGLLDSAFWHKFTLTEKSRVYGEWKNGLHKELNPFKTEDGLHFENERKSEKYGKALDAAVNAWMQRKNIETNIKKWFDFSVPEPQIPKNYIEKSIEKYELAKEKEFNKPLFEDDIKNLYWIASEPILQNEKLIWFYKQEMEEEKIPRHLQNCGRQIINFLKSLNCKNETKEMIDKKCFDIEDSTFFDFIKKLRGRGLVKLP